KMLYLEAGSGAKKPVPSKMIQAISSKVSLPLIVGGGIKNKKQMLKAWAAGADLVVVGTAFENNSF
ncbi:MAG TPA: geranylgeranylglyceryl/heptaprenylglyceryl phosphate synthase, partial [Flavobacteriales bacterium]|nr:geranylgeranylglyceryl/heptaprenylglyceryl phosphate synthase [Flavobacteriales bacterium]